MVKTLACLVVAMTSTSMLLGWLDPSLPTSSGGLCDDDIIRLARDAVTRDVTVDAEQWAEVHVSIDSRSISGSLLAAPAGGAGRHFVVDPDGRPTRTTTWTKQVQASGTPHVVHIDVVEAIGGGVVSSAQWLCIRALIASINRATPQGGDALEIQFDDSIDRLYIDHRSLAALTAVRVPTS